MKACHLIPHPSTVSANAKGSISNTGMPVSGTEPWNLAEQVFDKAGE